MTLWENEIETMTRLLHLDLLLMRDSNSNLHDENRCITLTVSTLHVGFVRTSTVTRFRSHMQTEP